jgi:hypothetical protein
MKNIPTPTISKFKEINVGKYTTTQHFEIVKSTQDEPETEKINLARDRQFAKSLPDYWLSYRLNNRWRRITGLFKVDYTNYYKGDKGYKVGEKHLIIALLDADNREVTTYTFTGYYSSDPTRAIQLIETNNL